MAIIQLDEEYSIEDTGMGYRLTKYTGKTQRGPKDTIIKVYDYDKYPASLDRAIELYARLKTIESAEVMTFQEYVKSINTILETIGAQLAELTRRKQ
jgi:hypothetical protein